MPQNPPAQTDLWFFNSRVRVRSVATYGDRTPSLAEHRLPGGDSPPLHVHHREDEVFHVVEGQVRFRLGDQEVVARAGETVLAPKGAPHTFRVESEGARMLTLVTAGDFEAMMREVSRPAGEGLPPAAEPTPEQIEALTAAAARNHIEIVGPRLDP
jgi:mannose-6-phosphate isomerase-like protein (cupin superfamily)